jgi:hypothetical protein
MQIEFGEGGFCQFEVGVVDEGIPPDFERQHHGAVVGGGHCVEQADIVRRHHVVEALPVERNERIDIDEPLDPVRQAVGDARDHHAAIGVADQADVAQIVRFDVADDRQDRLLEANLLAIVVLVVAGDRRAMHDVAALSQMSGHRFHFGAGVPRAVNQNVSVCHSRLPSISKNRTLIRTGVRPGWPDSATLIA